MADLAPQLVLGSFTLGGATLGALIGLGGGLLAARFTRRHDREQRDIDRTEERLRREREAAVELIDATERWASLILERIKWAAITPDDEERKKHPTREESRLAARRMRTALVAAELVVRDSSVASAVLALHDEEPNVTYGVTTPVVLSCREHGTAQIEVVQAAQTKVAEYLKLLDRLKLAAREAYAA